MAPQDWISPNSTDYASTPAASAPRPVPTYDLRPLAVGEILDRVLSIYRAHFWLLVGLSAVSAGVSVGVAVLHLVFTYFSGITIGSIDRSTACCRSTALTSGCWWAFRRFRQAFR